jgi:hypothetical protein
MTPTKKHYYVPQGLGFGIVPPPSRKPKPLWRGAEGDNIYQHPEEGQKLQRLKALCSERSNISTVHQQEKCLETKWPVLKYSTTNSSNNNNKTNTNKESKGNL